MKASRTIWLLLPVALITLAVGVRFRPLEDAPPELEMVAKTPEVFHPLEESVLPAKPTPAVIPPQQVEALVAVASIEYPVQLLEERGDAMLFEAEALFGTPFDHAITMPFD